MSVKAALVTLMVFSLLHLPIVWLLHAALALCAGSVKFGWVGHGFNGRSRAGARAPRRKRLGHLVKCRAGGKGVLWLNGSRSVRVLQGGVVGEMETVHSNSSRHACWGRHTVQNLSLLLHIPEPRASWYFFFGNDRLLGFNCRSVESWWFIFPCTTHEQLRSANEAIFVCTGSQPWKQQE